MAQTTYPKWIGVKKDFIPPPRCSRCGRLVEFDPKTDVNLPCKCTQKGGVKK